MDIQKIQETLDWHKETKAFEVGYLSPMAIPGIETTFNYRKHLNNNLMVEQIKAKIEKYTGIKFFEFAAKTRKREMMNCKHLFRYLVRKHTSMSLSAIGALTIGDKGNLYSDHSTILNSVRAWEDIMATETEWRELTWDIMAEISNEAGT